MNGRDKKNHQGNRARNDGPRNTGPRIVVRKSGIHGRGVYATRLLREDETVCEYKGEIISEAEVARRYPENMEGLNHTFIFGIEHDHNIDGGSKGNIARWINHSCDPNCDTFDKDKRMFIRAIRDIRPGEELSYDYCIETNERITKEVKSRWPCWCGTKKCRGTVLIAEPKPKKKKKAKRRAV
jgi:SET domain-containing protein